MFGRSITVFYPLEFLLGGELGESCLGPFSDLLLVPDVVNTRFLHDFRSPSNEVRCLLMEQWKDFRAPNAILGLTEAKKSKHERRSQSLCRLRTGRGQKSYDKQ